MKEWLEQGAGLGIIGAEAGVGFLVRMLLFVYYGSLYEECKRFEESRHKMIVSIKEELKRRSGHGRNIKNAITYTECRLAECRVLGFRIGWLENMLFYWNLFVLLSGVMTAFAGALAGCEERTVLMMLFVSGVTVLGLLATDMVLGLRDKYRRIRFMIRDYIENNWSVRAEYMEDNLLSEELWEKTVGTKDKQTPEREKKAVSKDKPAKVKVRKKGKAQEEKRRLTEELLRERRQLEARNFAERRRREQEVREEAEQVQEEAAVSVTRYEESEETVTVTQCTETEDAERAGETEQMICPEAEENKRAVEFSYEQLMREVLAEYLA